MDDARLCGGFIFIKGLFLKFSIVVITSSFCASLIFDEVILNLKLALEDEDDDDDDDDDDDKGSTSVDVDDDPEEEEQVRMAFKLFQRTPTLP